MKKSVLVLAFLLFFITLKNVSAQECFPAYLCGEWGDCIDGIESRTCQDVRCEKKDIVERRFCDNLACRPNIVCEEWTECFYTDKTEDIFQGEIKFGGYRVRICRDQTGCVKSFTEESTCEEVYPLEIKEVNECGKDYMVAIDPLSQKEIAKINLESWKNKRLDLIFTQGRSDYCPTCYNGLKDSNEEQIDCGGSCKPCREESRIKILPFLYFFWALSFIFAILIVRELYYWKKLPNLPMKAKRARFT